MKKILLSAALLFSFAGLFAQQNMTLYHMHDIVQSNFLNPAVPANCKWVVGFPVLGNLSLAANMPASYNDLGAGKEVINTSDLFSLVKNNNVTAANATVNLLMIGYRAEDTYFQFTLNERVSLHNGLSSELLELVLKGNSRFVGQTKDLGMAVSAAHYREWAFSATHDFGSDLWVGARAKLLFGRLGVSSVKNDISFYTAPGTYDLEVNSNMTANISAPGTVELDPVTGRVKTIDFDMSAGHFAFNPSNVGGGLDLGLVKTTEQGTKYSVSILNLGMISWSKDVKTLTQQGKLVYNGYSTNVQKFDDLVDSIKGLAKFYYTGNESFTEMLSPVLMAGVSRPIMDNIRLGGTGMIQYNKQGIPWALTGSLYTEDLDLVTAGISYTVARNSFINIGLGLAFHLGAFDIHFLTDNIIAALSPQSQRYGTLQFGVNFKFGCGDTGGRGSVPCSAFKGAIDSSGRPIKAVPCAGSGRGKKRR